MQFAAFSRPTVSKYFISFYSFTENYAGTGPYPYNINGGAVSRYATFGNAYKLSKIGTWIDAYIATFTVDDCGKKNYRFDSSGAVIEESNFFKLQMGGFTDAHTKIWSKFYRKPVPVPEDLNTQEKLNALSTLWMSQA